MVRADRRFRIAAVVATVAQAAAVGDVKGLPAGLRVLLHLESSSPASAQEARQQLGPDAP